MALSSLSDASVFKYAEGMISNRITSTIADFVSEKAGTVYVTEEQMEDVFYKIRHKSFVHSAKFSVLNMYRKGIIRLAYSDKNKLTSAIPFFKYRLQKTSGEGVIINISNYSRMKPDGSIVIDPEVLYTLMLSAAFSIVIERYLGLLINGGMAELYAALFTTVISKIVNLDTLKRDKIKYLSAKFMYIQLGVNELNASKVASKSAKSIPDQALEALDLSMPASSFVNLEAFITGLNSAFPEFSGLTLGVFFDRWMRSFGEFTAFSCEYVPSFVTLFLALIVNCNSLVNVKAIEKEASRHDVKLIQLYSKIESVVNEMSQK